MATVSIYYDSSYALSNECVPVILNKYPHATLVDIYGMDAAAVDAVVAAQVAQDHFYLATRNDYVAEILPTATVTITDIGSVGSILEVWGEYGAQDLLLGAITQDGTAAMNTTTKMADLLAENISTQFLGFTAENVGNVITITAPADSGDTFNSLVVYLTTSTNGTLDVEITDPTFNGGIDEVLPVGSVTITQIGNIDEVIEVWMNDGANDILLGSYKQVGADTTPALVADALADNIDAQLHGFTAAIDGVTPEKINITAPVGSSDIYGSCVISVVLGGKGVMTTSDVNFSSGVTETRNTWDIEITSSVAGDLAVISVDLGAGGKRVLGQVLMTGVANTDADTLMDSINEWTNVTGWSATNPGAPSAVVTLFPPIGLGVTANSYTVAADMQTGATSTIDITNNTLGADETLAEGNIDIATTGGRGEIITAMVDNGATEIIIGSYSVSLGDTDGDIATGLAASITANSVYHGYTAAAALEVVTITAPTSTGAAANTYTIDSLLYSPGQIAATTVNFTAGTASAGADVDFEVTVAGQEGELIVAMIDNGTTVDVIGEYKVQAGDDVGDIALGLVGSIGDNTVNHGYSASNLAGVITVTAPASLGTTPTSGGYEIDIDLYTQDQIVATKTDFDASGVNVVGDQDLGDMSAANATSLALLGTVHNLWSDPDYYPVHVAWTTLYPTKTVPRAIHLLGGYSLGTMDSYYAYIIRIGLMIFTFQNVDDYVDIYKRLIDFDNTAGNSTTLTTGQDLECLQILDGELWYQKYIGGNKKLGII